MKRLFIISLLFLSIGLGQKKYTTSHTIEWVNGEMISTIDTTYLKIDYNIDDIIERDSVHYKKYSDELVNGEVFKMFGSKKVPLGLMKEGKKDGKWTDWYENGQKSFEQTYKDGELDGLYTAWYKNGQKREEETYKDGENDGLSTVWYKNGQKWSETTYDFWKRPNGFITRWYENGQKREEETYKNNKFDGLWTKWYENGQKMEEKTYKDGERDGLWTSWYRNGQKQQEATYKDGELISQECWYLDGNEKACN